MFLQFCVVFFLRSRIFLFLFHGFAQKPNQKKLFALSSSGERPNNKRTSTGRTNKKTTSRGGGETKRVIGQVINLVNKKPPKSLSLLILFCVCFVFICLTKGEPDVLMSCQGPPLNINQKIICQTVWGGDIMSGMSFFFQEAKKNTHGRHWAVLFCFNDAFNLYLRVSEEKGLFLLLIEKITVRETHTHKSMKITGRTAYCRS